MRLSPRELVLRAERGETVNHNENPGLAASPVMSRYSVIEPARTAAYLAVALRQSPQLFDQPDDPFAVVAGNDRADVRQRFEHPQPAGAEVEPVHLARPAAG